MDFYPPSNEDEGYDETSYGTCFTEYAEIIRNNWTADEARALVVAFSDGIKAQNEIYMHQKREAAAQAEAEAEERAWGNLRDTVDELREGLDELEW